MATGAIASIQQSRTRWRNDWTNTQVETTTGTLGLIALDTADKKGTSIFKVRSLEQATPTTVPEADLTSALMLLAGYLVRRFKR